MNPLTDQVRFVIGLVLVAALGFLCWWGWTSFTDSYREEGRQEVQALWDEEKARNREEIERIQSKLTEKEQAHLIKVQELNDLLSQANVAHAGLVAGLHADYRSRLRDSEARADVYRRQAQGGSTEQDSLASHAAELDRTLTEGRLLVAELRATLGLRDKSLILLGQQITADRELLEESP